MDPERSACWRPRVKSGSRTVALTDVSTNECPASLITPHIMSLLEIASQNYQLHAASGANIYGPHAGRWPAWFADAVVVIQAEINRETEAGMNAGK